jgi:hypothetical protein
MMAYRLVLQDSNGAEVFTSYTRWLESIFLVSRNSQEKLKEKCTEL